MLGSHGDSIRDPPGEQMRAQAVPLTPIDPSAPYGNYKLSQDRFRADGLPFPQVGPSNPLFPQPGLSDSQVYGSRGSRHDGDRAKKASGVQDYFKDERFTGDITESIEMTIRDYNICANRCS